MDNRKFWNQRYQTLPEVGSGAGSRGLAAILKRELIGRAVTNNGIRRVVDIGCGDMFWYTRGMLGATEYLGVDISDVIVSQNKAAYPELSFIHHDITQGALEKIDADLSICLDVLLHQCDEVLFDRALTNLLQTTTQHALVSYPTVNEAEKTIFDLETTAEGLVAEEGFKTLLGALSKDRPYGEVRVYGDLAEQIREMDPTISLRHVTKYRAHPLDGGRTHSVYEISRTGTWLAWD